MGVRLYPNTKNPRNLEILAKVPEGTHEKLAALRVKYKVDDPNCNFIDMERRYEAFHSEVYAVGNEHLDDLEHFLLFGWGKFDLPYGVQLDGLAGTFDDVETIKRVFLVNDINADPALCEGLHYS
jgi:hypothetical protein